VDGEAFEPRGRRVLRQVYRALDGPPRVVSYWSVRWLLLRSLGFVYAVAFACALLQLPGLIGEHGLTPVGRWLGHVERITEGDGGRAFELVPSLFWLGHSDAMLIGVSAIGLVLSIAVMLGLTNALVMLVLWGSYLSIETVGQLWYAFGWESQLLETGMLGVFLCPVRSWRPWPRGDPPSRIGIGLFRWLSFRIWLGAGLIKWRGDPCWQDLTCLDYHFETQPIPNPFSSFFHGLPESVLAGGVLTNHFVELLVPFFVFGPRRLRLVAAAAMIGFQVVLILSGNLAFLNWLTIVPAIACLDDAALRRLVPARLWARVPERSADARPGRVRTAAVAGYAVLVAYLSIPVVANLMDAKRQSMNRNYDFLQLVNTYGAFGRVDSRRFELIVEGAESEDPQPGEWVPYEFKCKPGDPTRRPCWISPYHLRLDWRIWFAGLEAPANGRLVREAWVMRLVYKLLVAEPVVLGLLGSDPFDGRRPRWVRVRLFQYTFSEADGRWWDRRLRGTIIGPTDLEDRQMRTYLSKRRFDAWP
jgi:hypothetical protein